MIGSPTISVEWWGWFTDKRLDERARNGTYPQIDYNKGNYLMDLNNMDHWMSDASSYRKFFFKNPCNGKCVVVDVKNFKPEDKTAIIEKLQ